jgi:hypothetical protein
MRYVLMVYERQRDEDAPPPTEEQVAAAYAAFDAFHAEAMASGKLEAANRLRPSATATTVRVREGKTLTTDGPFAETKEQLGGFYIFDCDHLDEAIEIAARIPTASWGGAIEVRPLWEDEEGM